MEYTKLGNTGMDVSRICLGCMGFGDAEHWIHTWVLNEENSRPIIKKALELGINFFDTANVYSIGKSEEILGRALKDLANRDEVVIATKVHGKMHDGPNGAGLSRKSILSEIDKSLKRLGTDYVDLYQIHRWDYQTPIEETMEALHDVVRAGKARYLGASAMFAWQFQKALHVAEKHGWTRFVSMQDHLNLIYREEERETLPLCCEEKIYALIGSLDQICEDLQVRRERFGISSLPEPGGVRIPGHSDILENGSEPLERKEHTVSCLSMYSSWMDVSH